MLLAAILIVPADDPAPSNGDDEPTTTTTLPFEPEPGVVYAFRTSFVSVDPLDVTVGDTFIFENADQVQHTLTSDEGLYDSGHVLPGERYGYSYAEPGTYGYHCEIHPTMRGTVTVVADEEEGA